MRKSSFAALVAVLAWSTDPVSSADVRTNHRHPEADLGLETYTIPATLPASPFLSAKRKDSLLYFLYADPPRLERYDLATEQWLASILLPGTPFQFAVGEDLYVSFGASIYAFELDGTGQRFLRNQQHPILDLFAGSGFLLIADEQGASSVDVDDGAEIDRADFWSTFVGPSFDGSSLYVFFSGSPPDIYRVPVSPAGLLGEFEDTPYHGDFPGGDRTFPLAELGEVTSTTGVVFASDTLEYEGSLAGELDDLAVDGGRVVVERGSRLTLYGSDLLRQGIVELPAAPQRTFAWNDAAYAVSEGEFGEVTVSRIPFTSFAQPAPSSPPDPEGLDFVPGRVLLGSDGIVHMLSHEHRAVYRWSIEEESWIETVPLLADPIDLAVSLDGRFLFLGYPGGEITRVDLELPLPNESPLTATPLSPHRLAMAGEALFASDASGAWASHFTFESTGENAGSLLSWWDNNYLADEFVWSAANQSLYFLSSSVSPQDLHREIIDSDGFLQDRIDSPYHGGVDWANPPRVAPDGSVVVVGSGLVLDALTLVLADSLPVWFWDADWLASDLYTIRGTGGPETLLESWGPSYEPLDVRRLPGAPIRLFALDNRLLVVTHWEGQPRFWIRQANLDGLDLLVSKTDGATTVAPGATTTYTITVENLSASAFDDAVVVDLLPFGLEDASWTCVAGPGSSCSPGPEAGDVVDVVDVAAGESLVYTVTAGVAPDVLGTLRNRAAIYFGGAEESAAVDATDVVVPPLFTEGFEGGAFGGWDVVVDGF